MPAPFLAGEWWRLLTHPFLHVSAYHLALDGAAFLLLYTGLREPRRARRLAFVGMSGLGALLAALWAAPVIFTAGLCGLSGIAHGLTAVMALELMGDERDVLLRRAGGVGFAALLLKCGVEAATGALFLDSLHAGSVGLPVAVCHTGGVLGALAAWLAVKR